MQVKVSPRYEVWLTKNDYLLTIHTSRYELIVVLTLIGMRQGTFTPL